VEQTLAVLGLHTVCREARCPNRGECFSAGTATFLILGDTCTGNCRYCGVRHGIPPAPDPEEPGRVAEAARQLRLRYVVVTSVTRDDLPDGGASHFAACVETLRGVIPDCRVEVLVPDFRGESTALAAVLASRPDVVNHNVEVVPRLFPALRPRGNYRASLELLYRVGAGTGPGGKRPVSKSGLMVGLGETREEVTGVLEDLREAGCRILTVGQYQQPTREHHPVVRWWTPEEFASIAKEARALGFEHVAAGPLVRSSYRAASAFPGNAGDLPDP
jgi:lipoic acid synthetase